MTEKKGYKYRANMRVLTVFVDDKTYREFSIRCTEHGTDMSKEVRKFIAEFLRKPSKPSHKYIFAIADFPLTLESMY